MRIGTKVQYIKRTENEIKNLSVLTPTSLKLVDSMARKSYVWYKVKAGETIYSIAKKQYGNSRYWPYIAFFNSIAPYEVETGFVLGIPVL